MLLIITIVFLHFYLKKKKIKLATKGCLFFSKPLMDQQKRKILKLVYILVTVKFRSRLI